MNPFKKLNLQPKLTIFFLVVGLVPAGVIVWQSTGQTGEAMEGASERTGEALETAAFNQLEALRDVKKSQIDAYFDDRTQNMGVLIETVQTLRSEALNKLTAVRETRRGEIQRHFQRIENQVQTFSENPTVVTAVQEMTEAFWAYREDLDIDEDRIASMRSDLSSYYTNEFEARYKEINGKGANAPALLSGITAEAVALQHQYIQANPHPPRSWLSQ